MHYVHDRNCTLITAIALLTVLTIPIVPTVPTVLTVPTVHTYSTYSTHSIYSTYSTYKGVVYCNCCILLYIAKMSYTVHFTFDPPMQSTINNLLLLLISNGDTIN